MSERKSARKPAVEPTLPQPSAARKGEPPEPISPPGGELPEQPAGIATDFRWATYTPLTKSIIYRDLPCPPEQRFKTEQDALDWQNTPVKMAFRTKEAAAKWMEAHPNGPPAVLISNNGGTMLGMVHMRVPDNTFDPLTVDEESQVEEPPSPDDSAGLAVSRRDSGWRGLVPVRYLREYTGPKFEGKTFREYFPSEAIPTQPGIAPGSETDLLDRITTILDKRYPAPTCCLGEDWSFAAESEFAEDGRTPAEPRRTIDDDAWRRSGHQFRVRRWKSPLHTLAEALYDLEAALHSFHPYLPAAAIGDFWTSWEVERHLAEVSRLLARANPQIPELEIEAARYSLRLKLAAYAHEIRPAVPLQPPAKAPAASGQTARHHGPRTNMEQHSQILSIVQRICGKDWERSWPLKLDSIEGELDKDHVPIYSRWSRKYSDVQCWLDMALPEQLDLVKKRIQYSLDNAMGRRKGGTRKDRLAS